MDIKELLISDGTLSYGERKTFEKFLVQISEGVEFKEAIGVLLRDLSNLINKGDIDNDLAPPVKKYSVKQIQNMR